MLLELALRFLRSITVSTKPSTLRVRLEGFLYGTQPVALGMVLNHVVEDTTKRRRRADVRGRDRPPREAGRCEDGGAIVDGEALHPSPNGTENPQRSARRFRPAQTVQDGTAADVRYLKPGCAAAVRQLHDRITVRQSGLRSDATVPVLGGINGQSIARRLAAARAASINGRITGHSGRVGHASELTTRGASTTETMLAGGWKTARMVAHYSAGATAEQGAVAKYL